MDRENEARHNENNVTRKGRGIRLRWLAGIGAFATALGIGMSPVRALAGPTGPSARTVLIVMVDWAGNGVTPPAPHDSMTPAAAEAQVSTTDTAWFQSVSQGQFAGWNATALGWYPIATPPLDSGGQCVNAFRATIQSEANQAVTAAGFNPAGYNVVMYYFPFVANCGWGGWTIGWNATWINGSMNTPVTAHELGHTLGLNHGHSQTCTDSAGHVVALSSNCQTSEYGDPYDVMGCCAAGSFTAIQQFDLGWLGAREVDVPTAGGTYTLAPLENGAVGVQALRIVDGTEVLWLEYRQSTGVDSWLSTSSTNGVLVHRQLNDGSTFGSYLLDMTPGSAGGFSDAPLPAGSTWANPLGHAGITVYSAGPNGAVVTVSTNLHAVPDVRGDLRSEAATALQAQGFTMATYFQVDPTCNYLGEVVRQSPAAGSLASPGTRVSVWMATSPTKPCP